MLLEVSGCVRVRVTLTVDYEDDTLLLRTVYGELLLWLAEGSREAVAEGEVGIVKSTGERLTARVCVPYRYRSLTNTLELCGEDFYAADSASFTLRKVEGEELASFHPHEESCRALRTMQHAPLRGALCGALNEVKKACAAHRVSVQTTHPAPVALQRLYALYYRGVLTSVYDPAHDMFDPLKLDGVQLAPLTSSVPGGTVSHAEGTALANVIGSSGDKPKWTGATQPVVAITTSTSWRRVWEIVCSAGEEGSGDFCACAEINHTCNEWAEPKLPRNNPYIGGHVVVGTVGVVVQNVPIRGNAQIIPICKRANGKSELQLVLAEERDAAILTNFYGW